MPNRAVPPGVGFCTPRVKTPGGYRSTSSAITICLGGTVCGLRFGPAGVHRLFKSGSIWNGRERIGVPVPKTVAAAEFVGPWGRLRSVLAVEELRDMLPLPEAIPLAASTLAPDDFRRWKRGLIAEMARLTRLLHDRRRFHKDLYLCHFYIARADAAVAEPSWRDRVFLIDLHRLGRHPWTWPWWRIKDLAQLLYSAEVVGVGARDRLYFWQMYRGLGRRGADRWMVQLALFKWRRYRRHNARQKARAAVSSGRNGHLVLILSCG